MKAVSIKEINRELSMLSPVEIREICLRLARFKKENKELLTYLLFESADEESYISSVRNEIDEQFDNLDKRSMYQMKKGARRILMNTRKFIRYSQNKKTETDLLIYYTKRLKKLSPYFRRNTAFANFFKRQVDNIVIKVSTLHEDLQYDYTLELKDLADN